MCVCVCCVLGVGVRGAQSSQGGGTGGDGAAGPRGEAPPSRGQRTPMTARGTLGHSVYPATAVQRSNVSGAQPRLPHFSLQSTVPASCTQGQGHVNLNHGWKLEATRSQRPLMGCYIFPCSWHLQRQIWGDAESAPGWARAARAQQLALGLASQMCLFPAPEAPQLGTGVLSSLPLPSSFPAPGKEAPPASPRGNGAAETGTESKPSPQPSSPALGQSSRTHWSQGRAQLPSLLTPWVPPAWGGEDLGPLIQQTLSHSPLRIGELPSKATNFHGPEETGLLTGRPRWSIFGPHPSPPGCPPPPPPRPSGLHLH